MKDLQNYKKSFKVNLTPIVNTMKKPFLFSPKMFFLIFLFFSVVFAVIFHFYKDTGFTEYSKIIAETPSIQNYGGNTIMKVKNMVPTYGYATGVAVGFVGMILSFVAYVLLTILFLRKFNFAVPLALLIGWVPIILLGHNLVFEAGRLTALSSGIIIFAGYPLWYTGIVMAGLLFLIFLLSVFSKKIVKKTVSIFIICMGSFILTGCDWLNVIITISCEISEDPAHCYQEAAVGADDPDGCEKVKKGDRNVNAPKDKCHLMIAENSGDPTDCDGVVGGYTSYSKEECIKGALGKGTADDCENSENEQRCREIYGQKNGNCGTDYVWDAKTQSCEASGADPECVDGFVSQCAGSHSVMICENGQKRIDNCQHGCFEAWCRESEGKTDIDAKTEEEAAKEDPEIDKQEDKLEEEKEEETKEDKADDKDEKEEEQGDEKEKEKEEDAKDKEKEGDKDIEKEADKDDKKEVDKKEEEKEKEPEDKKEEEKKEEKCTGLQRLNPFCKETHDDIEDKVKSDISTIKDAASGKYMELLEESISTETDPSKIKGLEAYKSFLEQAGKTMDTVETTAQTLRDLKRIFLDSYDPSMDIEHMPVDKILSKGVFDRMSDSIFGGPKTEAGKEMAEADDSLTVYEAMLNRQAEIDFLKKERMGRLGDVVGEGSKKWMTGKLSDKAQDIAGNVAGKAMIAVSVVDYALTSFQDEAKKQMFVGLSRAYNRRRLDIQKSNPDMEEAEIHKKAIAEVKDSPYQDAKGHTFIKYGNILENADCQKGTGNQLCIDNRVFWTSMGKAYEHTHRNEIHNRWIDKLNRQIKDAGY